MRRGSCTLPISPDDYQQQNGNVSIRKPQANMVRITDKHAESSSRKKKNETLMVSSEKEKDPD